MVLSYQIQDAVRAGTLQIVLPKHEPPPIPIQLVQPVSRLVTASVRMFIELTLDTRAWSFVDL